MTEERFDDWSDEALVRAARDQGMPGHSAARSRANQAAAELMRRLIVQIAGLRTDLQASNDTLGRLTLALVILTVVLVGLTVVLVVQAF